MRRIWGSTSHRFTSPKAGTPKVPGRSLDQKVISGLSNFLDLYFRELTPYDVKDILQKINLDHWKYFLNNWDAPSPLGMLVDVVPVPPLCIRPSVRMTDEKKNEDDTTVKIFEMIKQKESISNFFTL